MKEQKCLNLGRKMPDLDNFGWNLKTILSYLKSTPSNLSNAKFGRKTKMPKFGTKNALFGHFWPKMLYLGIFDQKCLIWLFLGKNFKNTIVIFEISTLKFG